MFNISQIRSELTLFETPLSERKVNYFKTGPGEYAEHDQFIGVSVPVLRRLAKTYHGCSLEEIQTLMESPINEERLLALFMLVDRYQRDKCGRQAIYEFYFQHIQHINNWNLVDASAHLIVGLHLRTRDKEILLTLANSTVMWERRIAIVATWDYIKQGSFEWTVRIAECLLNDEHDLIHKAVGWMLREVGKRDQQVLETFLRQHKHHMPRTTLRYAIERFPPEVRREYLSK